MTMFTDEDAPNARKLVEILRQTNQNVPSELEGLSRGGGRRQPGRRQGGSFAGGYAEYRRPDSARKSFY